MDHLTILPSVPSDETVSHDVEASLVKNDHPNHGLPSTTTLFLKNLIAAKQDFQDAAPSTAPSDLGKLLRSSSDILQEEEVLPADIQQKREGLDREQLLAMARPDHPQYKDTRIPSRLIDENQILTALRPRGRPAILQEDIQFRAFDGEQLLAIPKSDNPERKDAHIPFRPLTRDQLLGTLGQKSKAVIPEGGMQFPPFNGEKLQQAALGILGKQAKERQLPIGNEIKQSIIFREGHGLSSETPEYREIHQKMGIRQFQNQFKDEAFFKPMTRSSESNIQDFSHHGQVMPVKEFLGNLQSQTLNNLDQMSPSRTLAMDDSLYTIDTKQLIEKISHYIIQRSMGNAKEIDLSVNHREIGNFRVNVSQDLGEPGIQLMITAFSKEGADFFGLNQGRLLSSLGQNGIKVQDFKLEQQLNSEQHHSAFSQESTQEEHSQARQDSHRRKELWKHFSKGVA